MLARRVSRAYSKDELMKSFSKPRLFIPGLTFYGKDTAISITPNKAKFGYKKDYVTMVKGGYFNIDFSPLDKDPNTGSNVISWQRKKSFYLNAQRLGTLISLPKDHNASYLLEMNYILTDPKSSITEKKTLKIAKESNPNGVVKFDLNIVSDQSTSNLMVDIQHADMVVIQKLAEFSLPYIVGWHALEGRDAIEDDLEEWISPKTPTKEEF